MRSKPSEQKEEKHLSEKMRQAGITRKLLREALDIRSMPEGSSRRVKEQPSVDQQEEKQPSMMAEWSSSDDTTTNLVLGKLNKLKEKDDERDIFKIGDEKDPDIIIYRSKEGSEKVMINGAAKDAKGEPIACRHLSREVVRRRMKGDYSKDFSTPESIAKQQALKNNESDASKIPRSRSYYNLFRLEAFGDQLRSIAGNIEKGEECSLFFQSENHAMAVSIRHKNNGAYVIKFYDPRFTNMHTRALCKNLDVISTLLIDHFITSDNQKKYFPTHKMGALASWKSSEARIFLLDESIKDIPCRFHYIPDLFAKKRRLLSNYPVRMIPTLLALITLAVYLYAAIPIFLGTTNLFFLGNLLSFIPLAFSTPLYAPVWCYLYDAILERKWQAGDYKKLSVSALIPSILPLIGVLIILFLQLSAGPLTTALFAGITASAFGCLIGGIWLQRIEPEKEGTTYRAKTSSTAIDQPPIAPFAPLSAPHIQLTRQPSQQSASNTHEEKYHRTEQVEVLSSLAKTKT